MSPVSKYPISKFSAQEFKAQLYIETEKQLWESWDLLTCKFKGISVHLRALVASNAVQGGQLRIFRNA